MEEPSGTVLELAQRRTAAVRGEQVAVERSLVGRIRGGLIELRQSGAGLALGRDIRIHQGAGTVLAGARMRLRASCARRDEKFHSFKAARVCGALPT